MLNKIISIIVITLLINFMLTPTVFASDGKVEKEAKLTQKVKSGITKLGIGTDSKIEVKLKDGTKLKGFISEINDEGFTITDREGKSTSIPYSNAKQVKGNNLSTKVIAIIGFAALFIVLFAVVAANKDKT